MIIDEAKRPLYILKSGIALNEILSQGTEVFEGEEFEDFIRRVLSLQHQLNRAVTGKEPGIAFEKHVAGMIEILTAKKEGRKIDAEMIERMFGGGGGVVL